MKRLRFSEIGFEPNVYGVYNVKSSGLLGSIYYYEQWKRFVFEPQSDYVILFSHGCLKEIVNFMKNELKSKE